MSVATPRVLVVSESRITRRVVEMTFADQPLQLAVFSDGAAAMDDWAARPPAVVIADIAMQAAPDGYGLARALRAAPEGQKAAMILLAGHADGVDEDAVAEAGVSAVLRKPLDSHQLIDAVRQALRSGPPAVVAAPVPVAVPVPMAEAVAVAVGGGAVAVAEPEPNFAVPVEAPVGAPRAAAALAADDVALLLGRDTALDADGTIGAWVHDERAAASDDAGLADTFHALLEVEQHVAPAAPSPSAGADVDGVARGVADVAVMDDALRGRLEAAIADRAHAAAEQAAERLAPGIVTAIAERLVREITPALVEQIAHGAVREEIARLRATRGA